MTETPEPSRPDVFKMTERQLLTHLLLSVNDLTASIKEVSAQLDNRPTREEVSRQRKQTVARVVSAVAAVLLFVVFTQDAHVEYCGPGARSEKLVNALVSGEVRDQQDFTDIAREATPAAVCDAMVPLHTHDHSSGWPTAWNIVGVIFYTVIGLGIAWGLLTRRWDEGR